MEQPTAIVKKPIIERPWRALWKPLEKYRPTDPEFLSKTIDQIAVEFSALLQKRNA